MCADYVPRPDHAERTILVGLVCAGVPRHVVDEHLDELDRLVNTAGGEVVERQIQERDAPDPATIVGSGFLSRMADRCAAERIETVVFDEDLTGSQVRNLERALPDEVKVVDRAAVILDIFAQRARTSEAQTQVELAQLSYLLPRLTRRWRHLSRQAGGIGTRGVGETQLEIDRRLISRRIAQLKRKLTAIERDRRVRRERRSDLPTVALVGYTNAGKSSLFRRLTHSEVLVEDRLFATLDPRARRVALGEGVVAVMTDTVGFIRKLPHHLVAPFRSTLEEAAEADLVLHLVDGAHPNCDEHLVVGEEVLDGLGVDRDRTLVVVNKIDLLPSGRPVTVASSPHGVPVSAVTGAGLEELRSAIRQRLLSAPGVAFLRVPLEEADMVARAIQLPHQLAKRFRERSVEVAMRVDGRRLTDAGLDPFRVEEWEHVGSDGGADAGV
jgi:GTP-binding protein HflX